MQNNLVEVVEKQNQVISMQADIINELFQLLSQHLTAGELGNLPVLDRIDTAARISAEII